MGRAWSESAKWFHVATVTMPVVSKMGLCDEPPGGLGYGRDSARGLCEMSGIGWFLHAASKQPEENPVYVQVEQVGHAPGQRPGIGSQSVVAVQDVLEHVVGGSPR